VKKEQRGLKEAPLNEFENGLTCCETLRVAGSLFISEKSPQELWSPLTPNNHILPGRGLEKSFPDLQLESVLNPSQFS